MNNNYHKVVKKIVNDPILYTKQEVNVAKRIVIAYKIKGINKDKINYLTKTLDLIEIDAELEDWSSLFSRIDDLESKLDKNEFKSILDNQKELKKGLRYILNKKGIKV